MKREMYWSITKFINLGTNTFQAAIYFNAHMIKSVFFRYSIKDLALKEENEIKRIYKEHILMKIGFSRKIS